MGFNCQRWQRAGKLLAQEENDGEFPAVKASTAVERWGEAAGEAEGQ